MGPPSYIRYVVDRNVVLLRMTVYTTRLNTKPSTQCVYVSK